MVIDIWIIPNSPINIVINFCPVPLCCITNCISVIVCMCTVDHDKNIRKEMKKEKIKRMKKNNT